MRLQMDGPSEWIHPCEGVLHLEIWILSYAAVTRMISRKVLARNHMLFTCTLLAAAATCGLMLYAQEIFLMSSPNQYLFWWQTLFLLPDDTTVVHMDAPVMLSSDTQNSFATGYSPGLCFLFVDLMISGRCLPMDATSANPTCSVAVIDKLSCGLSSSPLEQVAQSCALLSVSSCPVHRVEAYGRLSERNKGSCPDAWVDPFTIPEYFGAELEWLVAQA